MSVYRATLAELVEALAKAEREGRLVDKVRFYTRASLLIVDEIAYAVWAYHRFALSTADVEDLLAERGVIVSRGAVRRWVNRFGRHFTNCIRRDRPQPNDKRHLDEVVIVIRSVKHWLWRAIDARYARKLMTA